MHLIVSKLLHLTLTLALAGSEAAIAQPNAFLPLEDLQINLQLGKAAQTLQLLLDNSHHDHFDFAFVGKLLGPDQGGAVCNCMGPSDHPHLLGQRVSVQMPTSEATGSTMKCCSGS